MYTSFDDFMPLMQILLNTNVILPSSYLSCKLLMLKEY